MKNSDWKTYAKFASVIIMLLVAIKTILDLHGFLSK